MEWSDCIELLTWGRALVVFRVALLAMLHVGIVEFKNLIFVFDTACEDLLHDGLQRLAFSVPFFVA